ncbi:hypothetical protein QSE00_02330 [Arenibacter sp. M-2]|uniref:hypothetical protein n=1 Tax=unclassified Arenibacter TaxID=2615047 RepID=UPI000D769337|nr:MULTISPECIES: hypothetical protein [unclassified Arenibacter]MDL5510635.1 hypothetical protein [Arenibacter sp. M-2]PXX25134.1 hypothetical protein C7972_11311 [Arenibacter sp. ARW7G5Y1]
MRLYNQLLNEFKREQTGYSTIAIIGQSCIGSVAAMVVLMHHIPAALKFTLLFLVTILCMAYNGAVLARLSAKTTFNLLIFSVLFSIFTIVGVLI